MASSRQERDAKYLTIKVLEFLDYRLSGGLVTWRQLAGELDCTSIDVDKYEADGCKIGQSSTKLLLRDWENRHGGCDMDHLRKCLANIGRNDILMDLWEDFEKKGMELVEPRSLDTDKNMDIPVQNNQHPIQHIPQEGQEVVIVGTMYGGKFCAMKFISPPQDSKFPQEFYKPGIPMDNGLGDVPVMERKRHSDPLKRKDASGQSWSSGSMENIPKRKNSPKNLKKTISEVFSEKPIKEPAIHTSASENPCEEDYHQTQGDYHPLRSGCPTSVGEAPGKGQASPGKEYLLISSEDHQDKQWCKKLCNILKKRGHQVVMIHEVPQKMRLLKFFYEVDYVVVIYTENYKKEFQRADTTNHILFQHMQSEYKIKGKANVRFIPVYDVAVIRHLPDALLHGDSCELNYILGLLSVNKRPYDESSMHSSLPSQGTDKHPGRNNRARSEPVIVREFHAPPNPSKPTSTDKKESKSRFFWSKNKKEK